MRKIALFTLLMLSVATYAQLNFFVEGTGNFSLILKSQAELSTEVNSDNPDAYLFKNETFSAKYKNKLGGGVTAGMQYFFESNNISLDAGLDFNNVNFYQELKVETKYIYRLKSDFSIYDAGNPPLPSITQKESNHSLLILSVPLSISYYFLENNLSASLGALPGYVVYSKGGSGASADFNKFQVGIQIQLRYQFAPKIWLTGGFQEYSTKLYKPELKQSFSNLRLVKLGIRYDL